jgi:hypothetical protein
MSRLALIVGVTALACFAGPGSAWGCIISGGSARGASSGTDAPVHPGDPMVFSISNLDAGANWTVTVAGRTAGSGTTTAYGDVTGQFRLDDYGASPRSLVVSVTVRHPTSGSNHDGAADFNPPAPPLRYEPRPAPSSEEPAGEVSKPTPQATSGPAEAPAPVEAVPPAAPGGLTNSRAGGEPPGRVTNPGRTRATMPNRTQRRAAAPVISVRVAGPRRVAAAPPTATAAASRPPATTRRSHAPVRSRARTTPRRTQVARGRADDKVMPAAVPAQEQAAATRRPGRAWTAAGLALLTLLGGAGLGWLALCRRRTTPPDAGPVAALEVEAELQEMIAEHRANELTQRALGPPG